jgi:hypothetical protein
VRQPLRARNTHKILSLVRLRIPIAIGILSDKKNPLASVYYQTKRSARNWGHLPKSVLRNSAPHPHLPSPVGALTARNVALVKQRRFSKSPENFVWVYQYKTGGIEGGMPLFLAVLTLLFLSADNFTFSPILAVCDSSFLPICHLFERRFGSVSKRCQEGAFAPGYEALSYN